MRKTGILALAGMTLVASIAQLQDGTTVAAGGRISWSAPFTPN